MVILLVIQTHKSSKLLAFVPSIQFPFRCLSQFFKVTNPFFAFKLFSISEPNNFRPREELEIFVIKLIFLGLMEM